MKTSIIILITWVCFAACSNEVQPARKIDSTISPVNVIESYPDSVLRDSLVVYDGIKLGMTQKEYDGEEKKKNYTESIGGFEYTKTPVFDGNGKLYWFQFRGNIVDALKYDDEVKDSWQNLVDLISKKYGPASLPALHYFPEFNELREGYEFTTHKWKIGNKEIVIGVEEVQSSPEFNSFCHIYYSPTQDLRNKIYDEKNKNKKDSDATKF